MNELDTLDQSEELSDEPGAGMRIVQGDEDDLEDADVVGVVVEGEPVSEPVADEEEAAGGVAPVGLSEIDEAAAAAYGNEPIQIEDEEYED